MGTVLYGCDQCDYDECSECLAGRGPGSAVGGVVQSNEPEEGPATLRKRQASGMDASTSSKRMKSAFGSWIYFQTPSTVPNAHVTKLERKQNRCDS